MMRRILRFVLPLIVLAAGIGGARHLIKTRPRTERREVVTPPPLVRTMTAGLTNHRLRIPALGTVVPSREVQLAPEVSGRVVEVHPQLVEGGRVSAGEVLLRIDPRDYELAVIEAEARLEKAKLELETERGRQSIARREWDVLHRRSDKTAGGSRPASREGAPRGGAPGDEPDPGRGSASDPAKAPKANDLALRIPHIRNAEAAVRAAQSALERARLNVERCTLTAPFNAMIQAESTEIGQLVSSQSRLATLVGTDAFHVRLSVPVARLASLHRPARDGTGGAAAEVVYRAGPDREIRRQGRLVRVLGDLDPVGRMARLLVEVDKPLDGGPSDGDGLPLFLGAYVRAELQGETLENVIAVPREALRSGRRVWVVDRNGRLQIREITAAWRGEDTVFIKSGLKPGEAVVLGRLDGAVAGMALRTAETGTTGPDSGEGAGKDSGKDSGEAAGPAEQSSAAGAEDSR